MTFIRTDDAPRDQFDLFDGLGTPDAPSNPIEARFWDFHKENPRVYALFDAITRELIAAGHRFYSADGVLHVVRFKRTLETTDREFKVNNSYSAYFGRLWMREHPEHNGFFRKRRLLAGQESDALKSKESV